MKKIFLPIVMLLLALSLHSQSTLTFDNCPADVLVTLAPGEITGNADWQEPTATTTCALGHNGVFQEQGNPPNSVFPLGVSQIEYLVTDPCGTQTTCQFFVILFDACEQFGGNADGDAYCAAFDCDDNDATSTAQGQPCDDGNAGTTDDVIDENCNCVGTAVASVARIENCPNDIVVEAEVGTGVTWTEPTFTTTCFAGIRDFIQELGPQRGDYLLQGRSEIVRYILNDRCGGRDICEFMVSVVEPMVTGCNVGFSSTGINIKVDGLNAPNEQVQILDANFNLVFSCGAFIGADCGNEVNYTAPADGKYFLYVKTFDENWAILCDIFTEFNLAAPPNPTFTTTINGCPTDITVQDPVSASVTWVAPTVATDCPDGINEFVQIRGPVSGDILPAGFSARVRYIASDNCGGGDICQFRVSVVRGLDCPNLGLNIGNTCDDGDPNTIDDVVQPDCTCAGVEVLAGGCNVIWAVDETSVSIVNFPVGDYYNTVTVRNASNGQLIDHCNNWTNPTCGTDVVFELPPGDYLLNFQSQNSVTGEFICDQAHEFSIDGTLSKILTFDASQNERAIDLKWTLDKIEEGSSVEIQKSKDGHSFETITSENHELGIDAPTFFQEKDLKPFVGENFYRLMIVNAVGDRSFSEVRKVNISDIEEFGLFPNPAAEAVNISLKRYENLSGKLQLINQLGQVLREEQLPANGDLNYELSLNGIQNGIYSVWIFAESKRPVGKKLIVRKMY